MHIHEQAFSLPSYVTAKPKCMQRILFYRVLPSRKHIHLLQDLVMTNKYKKERRNTIC